MQRTKQALGIAPHEALFKKNKHTKKFTETLQRIVIYEHEAIQKPISENNIGILYTLAVHLLWFVK